MIRSLEEFHANLDRVRGRISAACSSSGRSPDEVTLIAVSKKIPSQVAAWAPASGQIDLGENYASELADKNAKIPGARWHFIGTLQSGTAAVVADHADVVHGVVSERAALKLARRAAAGGRRVPALIEVDLAGRGSAVQVQETASLADALDGVDGLDLVGLMTVPPAEATGEDARPYFERLRTLLEDLRRSHPPMIELSMGMSLDYEVAVAEGATMVRVGTALFGERAN
jgi:pyridoxal phosphate enzyme (YggS family)